MDQYVVGGVIKRLREEKKLTQAQLASRLGVSDKAVSKWETGGGYPDITLLEPLARELSVSVIELLAGKNIVNRNLSGNTLRAKLYVCPICGNVIHSLGEAAISCCGVTLPALQAEEPDEAHCIRLEKVENETFVTLDHPMSKDHYISFLAYASPWKLELCKLYPEGSCEARFAFRGGGSLYAYCNKPGLFRIKV